MRRPPREVWPLAKVLDALLMKMGRPACWLSHAVGRRQASLGTPIPRPPTEETFACLRQVNLRLNPEKCVFGVPSGKLLGFLVSHKGIEANPEKIKAIEDMSPPQTLKEMQKLAGRVTALGRFISKLGECALPFFKLMKKKGLFEWTLEADMAFQDLK